MGRQQKTFKKSQNYVCTASSDDGDSESVKSSSAVASSVVSASLAVSNSVAVAKDCSSESHDRSCSSSLTSDDAATNGRCDPHVRVEVRPGTVGAEPVAQYFPAPDCCTCVTDGPCRDPPLIMAPFTGPEYRMTPTEVYTLKASTIDTRGKAEIFEITTALGVQTLWLASARSDTFLYVVEGGFRFTVGLNTETLITGQFIYIKKGTAYGFVQLVNSPGRLFGMYLPPGVFGFYVESVLKQKTQFAADFDRRLLAKYDLISGYDISFRATIFVCKPLWRKPKAGAPKKKVIAPCPPTSDQNAKCHYDPTEQRDAPNTNQWISTRLAPIANTTPRPSFPHFGPNDYDRARPSPYYSSAAFAAPVFARTNAALDDASWSLLVGLTETDRQAEILTLTIGVTPFEGVHMNTDVALYVSAQSDTDFTVITIGSVSYTANQGFFAYVPRGTYFRLSVTQPTVAPIVTRTATFVVSFLGGNGTFGFYRNRIQANNIADAGSVSPVTAAVEIEALANRYCVLPPPPAGLALPEPSPIDPFTIIDSGLAPFVL